jgi:hypothetical protein
MPVYILLLIAVVPVLAMVATAGNALGRDAQLAAEIALTIILLVSSHGWWWEPCGPCLRFGAV